MKVQKITFQKQLLALVICQEKLKRGICFYTENESALQVGKHARSKGEVIKAHRHVPVRVAKDEHLQEVLYVEKGKMKVNFYTDDGDLVDSKILKKGDMVLLISGGHRFEFLEPTSLIEVKQGPYNPASREELHIKDKQ